MNPHVTFKKSMIEAIKGAFIASGVNMVWLIALQYFMNISGLPKGFAASVVLSTVFPIVAGAFIYVLLMKSFLKGQLLFMILAVAFIVFSIFPSFEPALKDGTQLPKEFPLITVPMNIISGLIGIFFITRKNH